MATFDPLNVLPPDPVWAKLVTTVTNEAAARLGCMAVLVAIQPEGKLAVELAGVPDAGPLHEIAKNVPAMLVTLAQVTHYADEQAAQAGKH